MSKFSQSNSVQFRQDALCINEAVLHGDLDQAFSILADLMVDNDQALTVEQFADYRERGLFPDPSCQTRRR